MKVRILSIFLIAIALTSCDFDISPEISLDLIFPEKTILYKGRIVEAYDTSKPVDSVLVQGCIQKFNLFPSWPDCDVETFTDLDGNFYISFKTEGLEGHSLSYGKEGYSSLDSCKTMPDGTLECYLQPLPTVFYIFSPVKNGSPFIYDSLVIHVQTETRDTTVHYVTGSFQNSFGDTSYYWTNDPDTNLTWENSYTPIKVSDNSSVTLDAIYFKSNNEAKVDKVTLFCPRGIGNSYKILDQ